MGDLGQTLLIFAGATGVFHLIMWLVGRNPRFWAVADYALIAFAALGLITATAEVRKFVAPTDINLQQEYTQQCLRDAHSWASSRADQYRWWSETAPDATGYLKERGQKYAEISVWFTDMAHTLDKPLESLDRTIPVPPLPASAEGDDFVLRDSIMMVESIDKLQAARDSLAAVTSAAEPTTGEQVMIFLYPYLLALALAWGLTKVTATLKGYTT